MLRRVGPALALAAVAAAVSACTDPGAGPCLHSYRDPVLTVARATDAATGEALPQVRLRGFHIDGFEVAAEELRRVSFNVSVDDDALLCDAPCGFGSREGTYRFSARTPLHPWQTVQVDARYHEFSPGCPSYDAHGDSVSLELTGS